MLLPLKGRAKVSRRSAAKKTRSWIEQRLLNTGPCALHGLTRRIPRRPGPLEVVPTQLARYVDDFTDEVESGDTLCFHGTGRQLRGADTTGGYFGFPETFGARRGDFEPLDLAGHFCELALAEGPQRT